MNKKLLLGTVVVVGLLVTGLWWATHRSGASDPTHTLTLYGNVDIRQVSLAFNGSERITALNASEGQAVSAGQLLGQLDDSTLRLRQTQVQAQIGAQEQALAKLLAGARPEERAQAAAQASAAQAEAQLASRQLARLVATRQATNNQGVSDQDLDSAQTRQTLTRAQADVAREAARLVTAGPRREDIALARQQLAGGRAELALLQHQIEQSSLHAPVAGVVRARLLEVGDMASPQRPVYTLALTQPKWVRAYVNEAGLGRLRPGMLAQVSTDSAPDTVLNARLGYIASVAEFTPKTVQTPELRTSLVYELRFELDDPQDRLRLGMPATVRLDLDQPLRAAPAASAGASAP